MIFVTGFNPALVFFFPVLKGMYTIGKSGPWSNLPNEIVLITTGEGKEKSRTEKVVAARRAPVARTRSNERAAERGVPTK